MIFDGLNGKIIVVTGGAGLLGRVLARSIAIQGGIAVVADIDGNGAQQVAHNIVSQQEGRAMAAKLDITSPSSVRELITTVQERYGRIDAVVNNAYPRNKQYGRKLEDVEFEDFCENVEMHLGGYFLVAQQFALFFREQGQGNIINVSSIYGTMAPRFAVYDGTTMTMPVEYAAIKAAVVHLTRYFAQYFKGDGIRVNCISPGGLLDGQPDAFLSKYNAYCNVKGMLDPRDINDALLFLLSDSSRYITGQNLIVDDGFSL